MLLPIALLLVGLTGTNSGSAAAVHGRAQESSSPAETVDALIRRARTLIEEGRPDEAFPLFEQALEQSGGSFDAQIWLIRGLIARGHVNVAFDKTDDLAEAGHEGPALDYLYGMATYAKAKRYIIDQVEGNLIEMNFNDAASFLASATAADPEQYGDALLPLAEAAWFRQDNATARAAAEKALARRPAAFLEAFLLGRIAFSQYIVAKGEEGGQEAADANWQAAFEAFGRAIANAATPTDALGWNQLAEAHLQRAYALVWKERREEAVESFAGAMGADPTVVNYRDLWSHLSDDQVVKALVDGAAGFTQQHGEEAAQDATLLWWLGWARFSRGEYERSEARFMSAIRKFPAFADARWYIGLSRYYRQDFDGAVAAMAAGFDRGPEQVVGAARPDAQANLAILDYLVGRCRAAEPSKWLEAAALSELQAALAPMEARYWNNTGLFLYDAAKAIEPGTDVRAAERRNELCERALVAYERAIELAPDDPSYLNDSAVVLQYGLEREFGIARERYRRAIEITTASLEQRDLEPAARTLLEQVQADARANLAELDGADGG